MGIKWKDFQLPKRIIVDEATYTNKYGKFFAEPFEQGYGVTLGNALRRVLLSSIEGTAVTSIKLDGVMHEFSTIPGVLEDVSEIILNIKNLVLRSHNKGPKTITINVEKKGEVKAKDVQTDETIEIIDPDFHIASLTEKTRFKMELEVGRGRGYVPSEINKKEEQIIGIVPIDSIFTPVRKVNFYTENTRVGQSTDYDRLIIEIWTNGSVEPKEALLYATNTLKHHLDVFFNLGELPEEEKVEELSPEEHSLYEKLKLPVSELELSVRSANCLREAKIKTLFDLVQKTEAEMLSYRNFGKKSLGEISALLKSMNLFLGMEIDKEKLSLV